MTTLLPHITFLQYTQISILAVDELNTLCLTNILYAKYLKIDLKGQSSTTKVNCCASGDSEKTMVYVLLNLEHSTQQVLV